MDRVNFFGTYISCVDSTSQIKKIEELLAVSKPGYITYTNVHVVVTAKKDMNLQMAVNSADIASPDGMPLVFVAKHKGFKNIERCCGYDMMDKILKLSCEKGYTNYFFGFIIFCLIYGIYFIIKRKIKKKH